MRSGFKFILLHVHIWLSQHLVYVCLNICPFILKDLIKYADEKERRARSGIRYSNPEVFMIRGAKMFLTSSHSNRYDKSDYVSQLMTT